MRILLAWLLLTTAAWSQITVPPESPRDTIIVATVAVSGFEGGEFKGRWKLDDGAMFLPAGENTIHIAATPGKHTITFSGVWINFDTREFEFVDYDGEYKVTGEVDPGPDPPIPPPGNSWGLILEETSNSNAEWARLRVRLRKAYQSSENRLLILDQSDLPPSMSSIAQAVHAANLPLPVLVVVGEDGEAVKILPCPDTVEGVQKEVGP